MKLILIFRSLVVALLVFAAFAKLQSLVDDTFYFRQFNLATVGVSLVELSIAALLLLECAAFRTWQLTAGLFCLFTVASAYHVYIGQQTCGCLGDISVHAKWMLAVDLAFLAGSGIAAVACYSNRSRRTLELMSRPAKLGAVMLVMGIALSALKLSGARLALFPGATLVSTNQSVKATRLASLKKYGMIQVPLANTSSRDISVVGTQVGCDTELMSQLPVQIRSGAAVTLKMVTALPDYAGESKMATTFYVVGSPVLEHRVVVRVSHD